MFSGRWYCLAQARHTPSYDDVICCLTKNKTVSFTEVSLFSTARDAACKLTHNYLPSIGAACGQQKLFLTSLDIVYGAVPILLDPLSAVTMVIRIVNKILVSTSCLLA